MKRKLLILFLVIILIFSSIAMGCNCSGYDFFDTNYHFNRAIIKMPDNSTLEIELLTWADAEGEQLTLTSIEGNRYLVSSINCILIEDN